MYYEGSRECFVYVILEALMHTKLPAPTCVAHSENGEFADNANVLLWAGAYTCADGCADSSKLPP
jgi:hypothetical protein